MELKRAHDSHSLAYFQFHNLEPSHYYLLISQCISAVQKKNIYMPFKRKEKFRFRYGKFLLNRDDDKELDVVEFYMRT